MSQVGIQNALVFTPTTTNWNSVNLEGGQTPQAMQIHHPSMVQRWALSFASVPHALMETVRPAPALPAGQPIRHRVGEGHGLAKVGAVVFGLIGFCCGYGFSTMAGEQLLLSVPSIPFNRDGNAQRTLATGLVGFNLPIGIGGLAVGAIVGAGLGAIFDACVDT